MNLRLFPLWRADLHIHSYYSDGKFSPVSVLERAKKSEINMISITDHDTVYGVAETIENCKKYGVEVIPGIEFSSDLDNREVHILGYFIDYENKILEEYVQNFRKTRIIRIRKMIKRLYNLGCKIDANSFIKNIASNVSIGRPHLANEMVRVGFVKNYVEAFVRFIGDRKPAYVKKENPDVKIIIKLIRKLKGISFVAHPGKSIDEKSLIQLKDSGINGIEVFHPSHSVESTKNFLNFAKQNDLLISGGSDFHGVLRIDQSNWGKYYVEKEYIDRMKKKVDEIKSHPG